MSYRILIQGEGTRRCANCSQACTSVSYDTGLQSPADYGPAHYPNTVGALFPLCWRCYNESERGAPLGTRWDDPDFGVRDSTVHWPRYDETSFRTPIELTAADVFLDDEDTAPTLGYGGDMRDAVPVSICGKTVLGRVTDVIDRHCYVELSGARSLLFHRRTGLCVDSTFDDTPEEVCWQQEVSRGWPVTRVDLSRWSAADTAARVVDARVVTFDLAAGDLAIAQERKREQKRAIRRAVRARDAAALASVGAGSYWTQTA